MPLIPRKSRFRTLGTVFSKPCVNAREGEKAENDIYGAPKQPSQASVASGAAISPKEPESAAEWPALMPVPGCKVGRPPEIEMAAADWHALEVSGFVHELMVQLATWMFGPDCTVVETGEAAP